MAEGFDVVYKTKDGVFRSRMGPYTLEQASKMVRLSKTYTAEVVTHEPRIRITEEDRLELAINKLPSHFQPLMRAAIKLNLGTSLGRCHRRYDVPEPKYETLARIVGLKINTVRSRLHRARILLQKALQVEE